MMFKNKTVVLVCSMTFSAAGNISGTSQGSFVVTLGWGILWQDTLDEGKVENGMPGVCGFVKQLLTTPDFSFLIIKDKQTTTD